MIRSRHVARARRAGAPVGSGFVFPGRTFGFLLALAVILAAGCKKKQGGAMAMPPIQVVVVEAGRRTVAETLSGAVGSVLANEMVQLQSETEGVVQEILFEEGKQVKKGDLLVRLDDSKFAAGLAEAEANFKLSQATYERTQQLLKDNLISQQEFDQAASSFEFNRASLELKKRQLRDTRIYAPFAGIVGARMVSPGQVIGRNATLTWVVDLNPVKIEVHVPERFVGQVAVGQTIDFRVAAYGNRQFKGTVYFIAPQIDPRDRTALIKATLPNDDGKLRPGMFTELDLTLKVRENSVVIPEVALAQVLENNQAIVFIVGPDQAVQARTVRVGMRFAGEAEILQGLAGGEKVIVEGIQKVAPGAKVVLAPPESARPYLRPEKDTATPEATNAAGNGSGNR